jgi:GGDEF domain-containing protein
VLAVHVDGLSRLRTELGTTPADETMRAFTRALLRELRVGDVAYRVGDDELAVLLPATDASTVPTIQARLADAAADAFARLAFPGQASALALRTAAVPLDSVSDAARVVQAVGRALELDQENTRWSKGQAAS